MRDRDELAADLVARRVDLRNASIVALERLADAAGLPFLVVVYENRPRWSYYVIPVNRLASDAVVTARRWLSEREYATVLYGFRRRTIPPQVFQALDATIPVYDPPDVAW